MSLRKTYFLSNLKRSAVFGLTVAGLFCVYTSSHAQRAGGEKPSRFMQRIDQEEGARRLAAFRQQRLEGDYCFEFELQHKTNKSNGRIRYQGVMWGSWNEMGPVTRFKVLPAKLKVGEPAGDPRPVELIIQNGVVPQVWIRRSDKETFALLEGEALFEPILPGLLYSPFDLQMPFVYWEDFTYEGPTLIGTSRVAQQFLMQPPAGSASAARGVSGVRVGLDDTYNTFWRIEVIDAVGEVVSRFSVNSIKKVQGQYIVKQITLKDYSSKDRTTFKVGAASVGILLNRDLFCPNLALSVDELAPLGLENL